MSLPGPYIYPTAANRWLQETGYLPPDGWDYHKRWRGNAKKTRVVRVSVLSLFQRAYPSLRVNEVTQRHLVDFLVQGRDARTGKPWSAGTVISRANILSSFFEWACDEDVDLGPVRNPATRLSLKLKGTRSTERAGKVHNWLTGEEVRALLDTCEGTGPTDMRDKIVIELLVNTGLRVSEASSVRWSHVNLFAGQLQLVGKGGKAANVDLLPEVVESLKVWKAAYVAGLGGAEPLNLPVLVSCSCQMTHGVGTNQTVIRWGHGLGEKAIQRLVRDRGTMIGRPTLAPHDLRRTFAGLLELAGVPIHEISWRLRHSSVATTEIYLKDNPLRFRSTQARVLY